MVIAALCFWDTQLCLIQVLNDWNTLIVQSILLNMVKKIRGYNSIITIQAHLICHFGWDQTPLLTHVIQCRIQVKPRYFINRVRPAWPGQNVTWSTRISRPSFNPDIDNRLLSFKLVVLLYSSTQDIKITYQPWLAMPKSSSRWYAVSTKYSI